MICTICFFFFFRFHTQVLSYDICLSVWLTSLGMTISRPIYVIASNMLTFMVIFQVQCYLNKFTSLISYIQRGTFLKLNAMESGCIQVSTQMCKFVLFQLPTWNMHCILRSYFNIITTAVKSRSLNIGLTDLPYLYPNYNCVWGIGET